MTSHRPPAFVQVAAGDRAPAKASAVSIVAREPAILADCIAEWLERSDERDRYERRILAAEVARDKRGRADGYAAWWTAVRLPWLRPLSRPSTTTCPASPSSSAAAGANTAVPVTPTPAPATTQVVRRERAI